MVRKKQQISPTHRAEKRTFSGKKIQEVVKNTFIGYFRGRKTHQKIAWCWNPLSTLQEKLISRGTTVWTNFSLDRSQVLSNYKVFPLFLSRVLSIFLLFVSFCKGGNNRRKETQTHPFEAPSGRVFGVWYWESVWLKKFGVALFRYLNKLGYFLGENFLLCLKIAVRGMKQQQQKTKISYNYSYFSAK